MTKRYLQVLILLLVASPLWAADRHVGSGQTYSMVANAISASESGDRIVIHQGTYNEYYLQPKSGTTLIGAFKTGNYPGESMPIINGGQSTWCSNDSRDVIIFYPARSNVTIDGLEIRNGGRDNIMFPDVSNTNITIQNCVLRLDGWDTYAGDNSANIHIMHHNSGITIQNNVMYSSMSGAHGVIGFQCSGDIDIKNNEIFISATGAGSKHTHGIFWKHGGSNNLVIENNVVWVSGYAKNIGIWAVNDGTLIKNNLVVTGQGSFGILIGGSMGVPGGSDSSVLHNTVYGASVGIKSEGGYNPSGVTFKDNIMDGPSDGEYRLYSLWLYGTPQSLTSDYNLFYTTETSSFIQSGSSTYTFSQWQGQGYDGHGLNALPNFSNSSGEMSEINDFVITSGIGNNAASDGSDMGADVTLVGVDAGEEPPEEPSTPAASRFSGNGISGNGF